ncbi:MAG: methyltransferase domain-containing protein [Acidobacteria bacterium]|nr:methyltransferase domain-containing protein [Acidobacteriota bacterium]
MMKMELVVVTVIVLVLGTLLLAASRGLGARPQEAARHEPHGGQEKAEPPHHPEGEHHRHGEEGVHHDFSDVERWAAIFEGDDRDSWQKPEEVVQIMGLAPGMTVADLGAGSGYFLPYLSKAVGPAGKVLALDPEAEFIPFMAGRAKEHGWTNVEARQIPFDNPGLDDGSVDRILIVNTWHHIDHRGAYAAKLGRTLKAGGAVYVIDFSRESPFGPSVESRLPPEEVLEELRDGGFSPELLETDLTWQYVIVARKP